MKPSVIQDASMITVSNGEQCFAHRLIYLFLTDDEASDNSAAMEVSVTKDGSETPRKKTKKQKKHKSKKKRKKRKNEKDSSSESEESDCGMQTRAR